MTKVNVSAAQSVQPIARGLGLLLYRLPGVSARIDGPPV